MSNMYKYIYQYKYRAKCSNSTPNSVRARIKPTAFFLWGDLSSNLNTFESPLNEVLITKYFITILLQLVALLLDASPSCHSKLVF